MRYFSMIALATALLAPQAAHAFGGNANAFGHTGQWVPNGKASLTYESQNDVDTLALVIEPSLLYFVTDHWAVGGGLILDFVNGDVDYGAFGLQPTVAYNLNINDDWSFFPQGSLYFQFYSGDRDGDVVGIELFGPFLYHIAPNFFLGIGPVLRADLSNDAGELFRFGGQSIVGGYF